MTSNVITGGLGILMALIFLGYYATDIAAVPLIVIIVAVLGMAVFDYWQSVRQRDDKARK